MQNYYQKKFFSDITVNTSLKNGVPYHYLLVQKKFPIYCELVN